MASSNAQLGFVTQAQVLALAESKRGSTCLVPKAMHSPIQQMAVLLKPGHNNSASEAFLKFLQSTKTQALIRARGYR
ncbi:MAG: substrate-binding domain-containing protein [Gammaproteobacteria bacterium]|nr:substrate-binding domain-containing protein [Gammaproteobacteria bacterium]MBQ0839365.1 substrate-binding domain-containing protein [Gammaproteobacteria bacterium]